jgi:hypothetical protein
MQSDLEDFMARVETGMRSEYEVAARQIKDARESDVVEKALSAARERLGMDAAYIATVDSSKACEAIRAV